ncbi:MAG: helix-turn-helix domain-containing protein [Planctomycetes bacterium]|nr:helix-turn-helix domain-containing protein [Planctomycetota bacterium]
MQTASAARLFEALSSEARLDLFRLLVRHAPDGLVAGEIARHLNLPATNLSFHLKTIVHSGLAVVEREGRYLRYRAVIPLMLDLLAFLTSECCASHPEKCRAYRKRGRVHAAVLPVAAKRPARKAPFLRSTRVKKGQ